MPKLIHPELSYQVRGALFGVYGALGPGLPEEFYQKAIIIGLKKRDIRCESEKDFVVHYEDEQVGLYYVDVWVEDGKILLELKATAAIEPLHKAQAISYLKVTGADLAIVANFGGPEFEDERLPNFVRDKHPEFAWQPQTWSEELLYPDISEAIYHACYRVHFYLGSGFLHQIYRRATMVELRRAGVSFEYIKQLPVQYDGQMLGYQDARLILVDNKVLLATFALRETDEAIEKQMRACMRRLDVKLGLLANFYGTKLAIRPLRNK